METKELKQYLKDVYDLESQIYAYESALRLYTNEATERKKLADDNSIEGIYSKLKGKTLINSYGKEIGFPSAYKDHLMALATQESKKKSSYKIGNIVGTIGTILVIIAVIITALITIYTISTSGFWNAFGVGIIFGAIIIGIPGVLANLVLWPIKAKLQENAKDDCYYKLLSSETEKANEYNRQVYDNLVDVHNSYVIDENNIVNLINELYEKNIVHPKYRNLVAISQIYEYIDTGRCTELEGPNGAYNLFESELRQNIIIDKLDIIIEQLEALNRTMSYVALSINQTNMLLNDISNTLYQIETNTALTSYNTQCIANNTRIANRYGYRYQ